MGILLAFIAAAGITKINLGIDTYLVTGLTISASVITIWYLYQNSKIKQIT